MLSYVSLESPASQDEALWSGELIAFFHVVSHLFEKALRCSLRYSRHPLNFVVVVSSQELGQSLVLYRTKILGDYTILRCTWACAEHPQYLFISSYRQVISRELEEALHHYVSYYRQFPKEQLLRRLRQPRESPADAVQYYLTFLKDSLFGLLNTHLRKTRWQLSVLNLFAN